MVAAVKGLFTAGTNRLPQGFRAVSRFPDAGKLARARSVVLELGIPIPVESWQSLATICDTPWLAPSHRVSAASVRIVRRRLRLLAAAPLSTAAAAHAHGGGTPIHLRGTCRPLSRRRGGGPIWRTESIQDPEGRRWLVEEGHDFLLVTPDGGCAQVLSEGGHLANLGMLEGGEEVSVFGFVDETDDRTGLVRAPNGRGGLILTLRSGSELPLLIV